MTMIKEQSTLATQQPANAHTQPVAQTTITTVTTQQAAAADQLIATTTTTKSTQEAHILADIATAQQEQ